MKFTSGLVFSGLLAAASAVPIAKGLEGKLHFRLNSSQLDTNILTLGFVVIVMENTNKVNALADPFYRLLADSGVLLTAARVRMHDLYVSIVFAIRY
ncbi:uncharacterized protein N7458_001983 [Penicillium daleae]|uniref:Uncharacterized protein n=1 Tax=Penicillium daleae TaxID=63821 RepID=A0AAD6G5T8_9EURO|nr:uncharacterized protein N7458_001983 [Penicillium daleae]KAJ5460431.1 hypothetical protein N7458_001983 [Penicillium daleae]